MLYKVFLVEDEIVTREGIRDNVDWKSAGFEFCGEAPDGEIALPLIEATQPDLLITDIKMPFMDGLQLCKILREHMPWIKIIILSGHDEFHYAQTAIQLGVTEYLLKPVSVSDLHKVLLRAVEALDRERLERDNLKHLRQQVDDNLALLREKFLTAGRLEAGGVWDLEDEEAFVDARTLVRQYSDIGCAEAEPAIGIGVRAAPEPLPHHLACGSALGGSTLGSKRLPDP